MKAQRYKDYAINPNPNTKQLLINFGLVGSNGTKVPLH